MRGIESGLLELCRMWGTFWGNRISHQGFLSQDLVHRKRDAKGYKKGNERELMATKGKHKGKRRGIKANQTSQLGAVPKAIVPMLN